MNVLLLFFIGVLFWRVEARCPPSVTNQGSGWTRTCAFRRSEEDIKTASWYVQEEKVFGERCAKIPKDLGQPPHQSFTFRVCVADATTGESTCCPDSTYTYEPNQPPPVFDDDL